MSHKIFKALICVAAVAAFTSCDNDDIYIGGADDSLIQSPDGNVVYLTDGNGSSNVSYVEIKDNYTLDLYLRSSKSIVGDASVTLNYDASVLAAYNEGSATQVAAFPEANVSLPNEGRIAIESGKLSSDVYSLGIKGDDTLDPTVTYAVPLSVKAENATLSGNINSFIVLVRDCSAYPGAEKFYDGKPGMKIISVIEVNDVNPLNTIGFTLKDSGKQFFDIVVLFSANINYNSQTGRVYISRNENIQALLDQREKYIKPLQNRGMKVVLGILGNHDVAGISTLEPGLAREFAKEVKNLCDAYELDGVFLDDEYTDYSGAASGEIPGFQAQSYEGASRMAYEIRIAQPSRLLISYRYGALNKAVEIDGMQPGQIFDYVCNDYGVSSNPVNSYPGLTISQAATGSWNCSDYKKLIPSQFAWSWRFNLKEIRQEGYGAMMIFNFTCDPNYSLTPKIIKDMNSTCKDFWDAELEYDNIWYNKDY